MVSAFMLSLLIIFAISILVDMALFDIIVRRQYRNYYSYWKRDGSPWGFFSTLKEVGPIKGSWARQKVAFQWAWGTPEWALSDQQTGNYLILYKISNLITVITWCFLLKVLIWK